MSSFYSNADAVRALRQAMVDLDDIERQKSGYDYSYPEYLLRDEHTAADRAADAVRFLAGLDDDEAGA